MKLVKISTNSQEADIPPNLEEFGKRRRLGELRQNFDEVKLVKILANFQKAELVPIGTK